MIPNPLQGFQGTALPNFNSPGLPMAHWHR